MISKVQFRKPDSYYGIVAVNSSSVFTVRTYRMALPDSPPQIDNRYSWKDIAIGGGSKNLKDPLEKLGETIHAVGNLQTLEQFVIPGCIKYSLPVLFESGDFLPESAPAGNDPALGGFRESKMIELLASRVSSLSPEQTGSFRSGEAKIFSLVMGDVGIFPYDVVKLSDMAKKDMPDLEMLDVSIDVMILRQGKDASRYTFSIYADPQDTEFITAVSLLIKERVSKKGIDPDKAEIILSTISIDYAYEEALQTVMSGRIQQNMENINKANSNPRQFLTKILNSILPT